jgi:hypothetical protein
MSELAAALAKLQADLPKVGKNASAQYGKYADLADVTAQVLPRLAELGLVWTCAPTMWPAVNEAGQFVLHYTLEHAETGDSIEGWYPLGAGSPQQLGSAITYARRYCLCAVTGVAPDEDDDDGQAATAGQAIIDRVRGERADERAAAEQASNGQAQTPAIRSGRPGNRRADTGPLGLAPEERPGSIDGRQRSRMMVAFKALGIDGRGERLADTVSIIGRPLTSSSELSWSEAEGVVRELEGRLARANLGHASQGSTP